MRRQQAGAEGGEFVAGSEPPERAADDHGGGLASLHVGVGVADVEAFRGRCAEHPRGLQRGRGIGLAGKAVARGADIVEDPVAEDVADIALRHRLRLVGDDREFQPPRLEFAQQFGDAVVGLHLVHAAVAEILQIGRQRRIQKIRRAAREGERTLDEFGGAVAREDLDLLVPDAWKPEARQGEVAVVADGGDGVEQRSVQVKERRLQHDASWRKYS